MKLYHSWVSSASRRVRLCMAEKGLDFVSVHLDLSAMEQHTPVYLAINPNGVVPTLQLADGRTLHESATICEFLDDLVPEPPLRPSDPYQVAQMRNFVRWTDERLLPSLLVLNWSYALQPLASKWTDEQLQERVARIPTKERREAWTRVARQPYTDEEKAAARETLLSLIDKMEALLTTNGPWLFGDRYTIADIAAVCFVTRIYDVSPQSVENSPRVAAWWQAMKSRPTLAVARIESFQAAVEKEKSSISTAV